MARRQCFDCAVCEPVRHRRHYGTVITSTICQVLHTKDTNQCRVICRQRSSANYSNGENVTLELYYNYYYKMCRLQWHCHTNAAWKVSKKLCHKSAVNAVQQFNIAYRQYIARSYPVFKRCLVFSSQRNAKYVDDVPTDEGNAIEVRAAANGKARSPIVARRVDDTSCVDGHPVLRRLRDSRSAREVLLTTSIDNEISSV